VTYSGENRKSDITRQALTQGRIDHFATSVLVIYSFQLKSAFRPLAETHFPSRADTHKDTRTSHRLLYKDHEVFDKNTTRNIREISASKVRKMLLI